MISPIMKRTAILTLVIAVAVSWGWVQGNETSENNPKMKKFLNLFPNSDANPKDKILTRSEIYTFLLNKVPSSATSNTPGYWGKQLKKFYKETEGKADKHDGKGANDGVLTKTELLNYVGK